MAVWFIIGTDVVLLDDRVCILYTSLDKLVLNIILVKESSNTRVAISCLHENVAQCILKTKFGQKALDIKHDQSELLISIYDLEVTFGVTIEIDLSISISIKAEALFISMLLFNPPCWQSLLLLNVFCATASVEVLWRLILIDESYVQSLSESGETE